MCCKTGSVFQYWEEYWACTAKDKCLSIIQLVSWRNNLLQYPMTSRFSKTENFNVCTKMRRSLFVQNKDRSGFEENLCRMVPEKIMLFKKCCHIRLESLLSICSNDTWLPDVHPTSWQIAFLQYHITQVFRRKWTPHIFHRVSRSNVFQSVIWRHFFSKNQPIVFIRLKKHPLRVQEMHRSVLEENMMS